MRAYSGRKAGNSVCTIDAKEFMETLEADRKKEEKAAKKADKKKRRKKMHLLNKSESRILQRWS